MGAIRKPFQGIYNILRFNRHLYLVSAGFILLLLVASQFLIEPYLDISYIVLALALAAISVSLLVSCYVYDLSGLYKFDWMTELAISGNSKIVNINAGFDETSAFLAQKFPDTDLTVYDFYDPVKHTEVSIKRARKAYAPFKDTCAISTSVIPLPDNYADCIFLIFAAHEIRNEEERDIFFNELKRILKPDGRIILLEHLRDLPNFLAYNIGFFHFLSKPSWYNTFRYAGLKVFKEVKFTPFITKFVLRKNGSTS